MDVREVVLNLKVDHIVILDMFEELATAKPEDARKLFAILRQLLTNHFIVEEFYLYPFARKKKREADRMLRGLFGGTGVGDLKILATELKKFQSVGEQVVRLMTECSNCPDEAFAPCVNNVIALVRKRIVYEEEVLLKPIDTSPARMKKKTVYP
ncbi:MAG: hemerythrin domain-containing protein [Magnetococcus sp. YQC-3]